MRPGGVIIPTPMEDGPGRRSCGACVWGTVISVPAQTEEHTKKGTRRKLSFLCRTSTPRNGTNDNRRGRYQRMYINDENMFYWLMISAEKGDTFVFFGEYQEHEYYARERHKGGYYDKSEDKILKIGRDFYVQFAIPAQAIRSVTRSGSSGQRMNISDSITIWKSALPTLKKNLGTIFGTVMTTDGRSENVRKNHRSVGRISRYAARRKMSVCDPWNGG